jgi:DNA-binding winged helix-turn-helix (wHTH) protein
VFELDLRSGELRKAGSRINLPDQPFRILAVLLEYPGELVTRDELRSRVWPTDTFVDFEHGLNAGIKRLRDALGDSADTPRFIETLPRRGYRFIAPVDGVVAASASSGNDVGGAAVSGSLAESQPGVLAPVHLGCPSGPASSSTSVSRLSSNDPAYLGCGGVQPVLLAAVERAA